MKTRENINFHYDKKVDVLYASVGKPKPAKSIETDKGYILRVDPHTGDPIGFTIIHYMKRINKGLLKSVPEFKTAIGTLT